MRLLVIGGGVAGPAVALAATRLGLDATVLERRPVLDPDEGSWITVAPNGLDALVGAGRARRRPRDRRTRAGSTGCTAPPDGTSATSRSGSRSTTARVALTMKRSALAAVLEDAARRRGADVRFGAEVVSVQEDADGVRAVLADGSVVEGDLLVAADGVHSLVRRSIDPAAPDARYVGLTNFGGITRGTRPRRRPHPAGLALRVRAAVVLRRAPAAERRRRVVRQRAAPGDRPGGAGRDHARRSGWPGWPSWSRTTPARHPPSSPPAARAGRATAPSTCRTCPPGGAAAPCSSGTPRTPRRRAAARARRWRSRTPWCWPGRWRRTEPTAWRPTSGSGATGSRRSSRRGPQQQREDPRPAGPGAARDDAEPGVPLGGGCALDEGFTATGWADPTSVPLAEAVGTCTENPSRRRIGHDRRPCAARAEGPTPRHRGGCP